MELDRQMIEKLLRLSDEARLFYFHLRFMTMLPKNWECQPLLRVREDLRLFYFPLITLLPECPFDADAESVRGILGELFPKLTIARVGQMLDDFERNGLLCRLMDRGARLGWWLPLSPETGAVMEPPRFEEMPGDMRKAFAECLERARPN
jgi:hypothetical protein